MKKDEKKIPVAKDHDGVIKPMLSLHELQKTVEEQLRKQERDAELENFCLD